MSEVAIHECKFLIPVRGDKDLSDGALHSIMQWNWFREQLTVRFGGWHGSPKPWPGEYDDADTGYQVTDLSYAYFVALPKNQVDELRKFLSECCGSFHQKEIYLAVGGNVEFIKPKMASGQT